MKILISGASKGLGFKITTNALKKGWEVIGLSRVKNKNIQELMQKHPNSFRWNNIDLSQVDNLKENIYDKILKHEKIDGFINNAAYAYDDLITNLKLEKLRYMYNINVLSPIMITKLVLRNMLLHKTSGSIIHLSSISAHTGYKGLAMYASTKGSLEAFSKNCSREWGSLGIRSNCVVAGFMETSMSSTLTDEQKNRIYKRTAKKEPVSIRSVAETVCFLLSNESSSITGQNIFVDNGTI